MKEPRDLRTLLRSAAVLAAGRQAGAVVFTGALLVLPRLAPRGVVDDFLWAFFATLFLTSILNLGLERVVGVLVARRPSDPLAGTLQPVLVARACSTLLTVVSLWALYRFVGVSLPAPAWVLSLAWIVAVQVQGVTFSGLRAVGRTTIEPWLAGSSRLAESVAVVALAHAGVGIVGLIGAMTAVEAVVAAASVRAIGTGSGSAAAGSGAPGAPGSFRSLATLPWATIGLYTGVEVLGFAYLRVDVALVGRLGGSGPGATYALVYRLVDALTGLLTPVLLLLFPVAAGLVASGEGLRSIRRDATRVIPAGAAVMTAAALGVGSVIGFVVPRFDEGLPALRVLLVTVPLYAFCAVELYLRSAEGRNRQVLAIGAVVLATNVGLNLVLIPSHGLPGAAWALVLTEILQLGLVMATSTAAERSTVVHGRMALGYATAVAALAVLSNAGRAPAAMGLAALLVGAASSVVMRSNVRVAGSPA